MIWLNQTILKQDNRRKKQMSLSYNFKRNEFLRVNNAKIDFTHQQIFHLPSLVLSLTHPAKSFELRDTKKLINYSHLWFIKCVINFQHKLLFSARQGLIANTSGGGGGVGKSFFGCLEMLWVGIGWTKYKRVWWCLIWKLMN